ncbi:MAG: hypothetical protein EBY26_04350 [Microbacteriaceae bacterium]|nr:hypothetical protein [Microbacteriaceae bacterium]
MWLERKGKSVLQLLNPKALTGIFRGSEETTDFVPESAEYLEKVLADTYRRIRFRRLRQIATILAISGLAVAGIWAGYSYTQTKFYVGESNGHVTIFKGIRERLGPLTFSSVYSETDVLVTDLSEYQRGLLERTIYATDIADANRIIQTLTQADSNG